MDAVETVAVGKRYGRLRALAGVSLRVAAGAPCALLGENGAGKSTLLALLAGAAQPASGEIHWGGARAPDRAAIGVVAHAALVYGDLTARENLRLFARLYALPDGEARAGALLSRVGLAAHADRPARTLSRGLLQRLALARALVHAPRLLLLDEPFTGLDAGGVAALRAILAEEAAAGAIVVVATHDLAAIAGLCPHAAVLRAGALAAERRGDGPLSAEELRAVYEEAAKFQRGRP